MRLALLAAALLAAGPALAQAPPPPGPGVVPAGPPGAPPPPGPRPPPPPPPRGPAVIVDRGADHTFHVDVRCLESESTRACVDLATQLVDRLNGAVQAK